MANKRNIKCIIWHREYRQIELLNIAYRLQVVIELNGPIFWETESILYSVCILELECTSQSMPSAARRAL